MSSTSTTPRGAGFLLLPGDRGVQGPLCEGAVLNWPRGSLEKTPHAHRIALAAMAKPGSTFNGAKDVVKSSGLNPGLIVLIVVLGSLIIFLVGNFFLYRYAQKTLPPKKKKPVSKKKLKKEKLKGGVRPPGD